MSIKFAIRPTSGAPEKEGEEIIRFTGISETFNQTSERSNSKVGVDGGGNPRIVFTTGLQEKRVQFYRWYNEDEKKEVIKQIKELKPVIQDFYGGAEVIEASNQYFWKANPDINKLKVNNATVEVFYDTARPDHALLYLSIIAGAFDDVVAPTKEWAQSRQIPHYLVLETDTNDYSEEVEITRSDAHGALGYLRNEQPEALFIIAWCIQYDTTGYGAYTKASSQRDLINYHIKYIDGKLTMKKKRNCPKLFIEYVEKWKGTQTRPLLFAEAYVKAGEYFAYLNKQDKKYTTPDGTILGNTFEEAVENLQKHKFNVDYEKLRDYIEAKWAE